METPNNQNGLRTELIMSKIEEKIYNNDMPTDKYNKMYSIVYDTLESVSLKNLLTCLKEGMFKKED